MPSSDDFGALLRDAADRLVDSPAVQRTWAELVSQGLKNAAFIYEADPAFFENYDKPIEFQRTGGGTSTGPNLRLEAQSDVAQLDPVLKVRTVCSTAHALAPMLRLAVNIQHSFADSSASLFGACLD